MQDDIKRVEDAVAVLIEHFDSVFIACTLNEEGDTYDFTSKQGNTRAIYGQLKLWIMRYEESVLEAEEEEINDTEDDGE